MTMDQSAGVSPEFYNTSYAEALKLLDGIDRMLEMDQSGQIENKMTPLQLYTFVHTRIGQQDDKTRIHLQTFEEEVNALIDAIPDEEKSAHLSEEKIARIREQIRTEKSRFSSN